jgi:hypothetical protein
VAVDKRRNDECGSDCGEKVSATAKMPDPVPQGPQICSGLGGAPRHLLHRGRTSFSSSPLLH